MVVIPIFLSVLIGQGSFLFISSDWLKIGFVFARLKE